MTTFPVQLPPPSPALRLHAAAAHLRRHVTNAVRDMQGNDYWRMGWHAGVTNAIGGAEGELLALFTPETTLLLADWLDELGAHAVRHGPDSIPSPAATIADAFGADPT